MKCRQCGKEFDSGIPCQKFCSEKCCRQNYKQRCKTGEPPPVGDQYYFYCGHCGKLVFNDGKGDMRYLYCSRRCQQRAKEQRKEERKRHRGDNLGMSGGMCLGNLIRRERRSLG